ncbi:MAG: 30S ribosomal protein S17e [Candidatus Bathyarchaeia archaeon]
MGNVRTEQIKRTAKELIRRFPDRFSADFEENKKTVGLLTEGTTNKIRNQIAGYITRYITLSTPVSVDEEKEAVEGDETNDANEESPPQEKKTTKKTKEEKQA